MVNNTASITASQWDPATGNSAASVNGLPVTKQVDLSVSMSNAPDPIFVSQQTVYTMVVKNNSTAGGASSPVYTIGDLSTVWLIANVREVNAPLMRVGQPVEVHVLAFSGRIFTAKISWDE